MTRRPEKASDMLALVEKLLDEGKPKEAAELVRSFGTKSSELGNAYGVALLRCGDTAKAVEVFRGLCVGDGGVALKPNLSTPLKANYATALLLARNLSGCRAVLREITEQDPYVERLDRAIDSWRRSLPLWKRLAFDWAGYEPDEPVVLDFPPGDPALGRELRPAV